MKALSLWQPWASLMAVGAKKIETRSWPTNYRGLVAIHSAKRFQEMGRLPLGQKRFHDALDLDYEIKNQRLDLPPGCFISVGRLHRLLSTTAHAAAIPDQKTDEFWFGDYSPNRFMWFFDEVWKLKELVYTAGHQGLWVVGESEQIVIEEMLPEEAKRELVTAQ